MIKILKKIINYLQRLWSLSDNGERVDLVYKPDLDFNSLDMYQKSHFRRYEFAASRLVSGEVCGDFACGSGYGTVMLSQKASRAHGADRNARVIEAITNRYCSEYKNVNFEVADLMNLNYESFFDTIVSFETIEHFTSDNIIPLLKIFNRALKQNGRLIFSTPYMQEASEVAIKMGFHLTFDIDENVIKEWLAKAGFEAKLFQYQNYETHDIADSLEKKEFIICEAIKL